MKNKLYFPIVIFFFSILNIYAQSNYSYYYKDQKVYLTLDKTNITLSTYDDFQKSSISSLNFKDFNIKVENTIGQNNKYANIEFQNIPTELEYFQKINALNSNPKIIKAQPNFRNQSGAKIGMSDYFYVKLKDLKDLNILQKLSINKNVQIIEQNKYMPLWFTLKCQKKSIGSTLEIANFFFETGYFVSAVPDFLADDLMCSNDADFGSLWGLNNNVNPNIDINVCQAWVITQGNGIKVAVLDEGIELTHQDLSSNIFPLSYNTETNSSPSQVFGGHGTHVAGTIAAIKDNNIQVVGVSPLSNLMSVSNSLQGTPNSRIKRADGINWAYLNGADIINNSWGSAVQYQAIDDAIENAITSGRNGKGTIIVFASGNDNGAVNYPANVNPKIIAVGAITSSGNRSNFSNYGSQLDVVAPGSEILSTMLNNTTGSLSGTSMASPHISGVCALILSANPCLTGQQVRDIIEQTAQKVGGYSYSTTVGRPNGTWNNQMGYGLVDAFAAVQMAQSMVGSAQISGFDGFCTSATYSAAGGATTYNWTITQGVNLVNLTGNGTQNVTLTALPNASGQVNLSLTLGGNCGAVTINKTIWVGKPIVTLPTDCWDANPTTPNCFSICQQTEMTTSNYVFVQGIGLDAVSNQYDSWEWEKITNNFDLSYTENSAYINPLTYLQPAGYLGYRVRVKNACGWSDWFENYLDIIDCSNGGGQNLYSIFPNPSKDVVNITLKDSKIQPSTKTLITGELFDIVGQSKRKVAIKNNSASLSVAGLQKGVYVLHINIDGKVEGHQVIVE